MLQNTQAHRDSVQNLEFLCLGGSFPAWAARVCALPNHSHLLPPETWAELGVGWTPGQGLRGS